MNDEQKRLETALLEYIEKVLKEEPPCMWNRDIVPEMAQVLIQLWSLL